MAEWTHSCKDGRVRLIPCGELCDRCGQEDAIRAAFAQRYGYEPDDASEEDREDFAIFKAGASAALSIDGVLASRNDQQEQPR